MRRRYEQELAKWLRKKNRKPLVVRGARQVGKSTLVRQFTESEKLTLFEVNLERNPQLLSVIETLDPVKILAEIEFVCRKGKIDPKKALLFVDEIQGVPKMLQALRYFYEEMPDLAVVAAGSLLEFTLSDHPFPMPVGRIEYFHVGPVSWEEFLVAKGELDLAEYLENYQLEDDFSETAHGRLLDLMRDYFMLGGMPEAVQLHCDGASWDEVISVQTGILETYRDDFSKYATGKNLVRLQAIIDYLARGLGAKVKYANIDRDSNSRDVKQVLDLIIKAGVVLNAVHSQGNGIPLNAQIDPKVFKLYCLDLGLYNRICRLDYLSDRDIREDRFVNEGGLAEQFIAQQLAFLETPLLSPSLNYWLRDGNAGNAEVDFLIQVGRRVVPVEVKSGKSGSLKSLLQFVRAKKSELGCRFDLNLPSSQSVSHGVGGEAISFRLVSLPLYLCNQVQRLLRYSD